jgi:uncharacterized protein (TIGR00290 family)
MSDILKAVVSYSGGKDGALAFFRAKKLGYEPMSLLTTYNKSAARSWFHGVPTDVLHKVAESIGVPIEIATADTGDGYGKNFETALIRLREKGAEVCIFGDIDIDAHREWNEARCRNSGLKGVYPLWQENRKSLVYELIDSGFKAVITIVDTKQLPERFIGRTLTRELAEEIAAEGADICGENGEYHSFVYDGPIFSEPIDVKFGSVLRNGDYSILPVALN